MLQGFMPGETFYFLNGRISRTQLLLGVTAIALIASMAAIATIYGLWGWTRYDIDQNDNDISKLQKKTNLLLTKTFYVATNGSDKNPGTEKKPFLTVKKASDASSYVSESTVIFGPGTFQVNASDFMFDNINLTGSLETVITAVTVTNATQDDYNRFILTVTNSLVPDALANLYYQYGSNVNNRILIEGNTADTITLMARSMSIADAINTTGSVLSLVTTIEVLDDGTGSVTYSQSGYISLNYLMINAPTINIMSGNPIAFSFIGCAIDCGSYQFQFARYGNGEIGETVFTNCSNVLTYASTSQIYRSIFESSHITIGGGNANIHNTNLNDGYALIQYSALATISSLKITTSHIPIIVEYSSMAYISNCYLETSAIALTVDQAIVSVSDLTIVETGNNYLIYLKENSIGSFFGVTLNKTIDTKAYFLLQDSEVYFGTGTYSFSGPTNYIITATTSDVVMDNVIMNIDAEVEGAAVISKFYFYETNLRVQSGTFSMTNMTSPIFSFINSKVNFGSGSLTINTSNANALLATDSSTVAFQGIFDISIATSTASSTNGPFVITDFSNLILAGTQTFSNPLGLCIYAGTGSSIEHQDSATTTFSCGTNEFYLQDLSRLIFDSTSTVILANSANSTVLGGTSNATTFYLGTADFLYTDGTSGAGIQGCQIRTT